jgi:acyl-CoA thioester hydrolase
MKLVPDLSSAWAYATITMRIPIDCVDLREWLVEEMPMSFPTPYDRFEGTVRPEWIDPNGHMNLAYYIMLFDHAFDHLLAEWDLDWAYTKRTKQGLFAVETHTLYERELLVGGSVRVHAWVIEVDSKRLHIAQEMYRLADMRRAACCEVLNLHVDLDSRRVVPWPEGQRLAMEAAAAAHGAMRRPDWVGRKVQMRR